MEDFFQGELWLNWFVKYACRFPFFECNLDLITAGSSLFMGLVCSLEYELFDFFCFDHVVSICF